MDINPLRRIYENNLKIEELKKQIKTIEEENQRCLDYAMVKRLEKVDNFVIRTSVSPRREPISSMVIERIGSESALKIAKFTIKDLEKLMGEEEINGLCKVNESIKRVVEMVNE